MLTKEQKVEFASLRVEIINLNIIVCCYIRKMNRLGFLLKNVSRHDLFEEFTALRYLENGVILHLTNLDDESSNYSFRKIRKAVHENIKEEKTLKQFNKRLESYRKNVNGIKTKHRNKRIAHLNYLEDPGIYDFLSFDSYLKPLIIQANELGDLIWGEKINYKFKLGTVEGILDFREIFENLKCDYKSQEGF
jgi:hypothetical protein